MLFYVYCTHIKAGLENWGSSLDAKKWAYLWLFSPSTAVKISWRKLSAFTGVLHMLLTGSIPATLLLFSLFRCVKTFVMTGRFSFLSKYFCLALILLCYLGVTEHGWMKHRSPSQLALRFDGVASPLCLFSCSSSSFLVCHLYVFLS